MEGKNGLGGERGGLGNECGEPGDKKNVIKLCCKEPENEVGFHLRPNVNDGARYIKKRLKAFQASVSCFDHRFNWRKEIRNLNPVSRLKNAGH